MISNCGKDENGRYSGGQAGDQTGKEYTVQPWYNRPWTCVLRYPEKDIRRKLAEIARAAAENDNIGYDQSQRLTYYNSLKAAGWEPSKIKQKCEADCSASTAANVIATGYLMNVAALKTVSPSLTTRTIREELKKAGFQVLTDSKFTKSEDYLRPGDILLCEGHHVAINLDKGKKVEKGGQANGK